jgi:membrane protease YdiL (CAAX protease family)
VTDATLAADRPPRRVGAFVLVVLLVVVPLFVVGELADQAAARLRDAGVALSEQSAWVVVQAIHFAWAWWLARRLGVDPARLVRRPERAPSALGVLATVATLPFSVTAVLLSVLAVAAVSPDAGARLLGFLNAPEDALTGHALALAWFSDQLAAPALEEFVMRGVLLHAIAARSSFARGVVVSTVVFSILHADPFGAALFSLVMVALMVQTGSVIVPMLAHAAYNASLELLSVLDAGPDTLTAASLRAWSPWLAVACLASGAVIVTYLRAVRAAHARTVA